jgi:uncharacterized membrane protein YqjE
METTDDTSHAAPGPEPSAAELIKLLPEQASTLIRDELKLAQLELANKGKQAGLGISLLGGSGLIAFYAVGCLLACAVIAMSAVVAAWLAALIVGAALLVIAASAALAGKGRLRRATPPVPVEAVGSVKADVEEIKERARS